MNRDTSKSLYSILFLLLILVLYNIVSTYPQTIVRDVSIEVNIDGTSIIYYKLYVPNPPVDVTIRVPDEPIYFTVYVNGSETPAYYEDGRLSFYAASNNVEIEVLSGGLTRKEGIRWIFEVSMQYPFKLILPRNSLILNISTQDFSISVENDGRLSLLLPKGNVTIVYTFPPATVVDEGGEAQQVGLKPDFNIIPIAILTGFLAIIVLYLLKGRRNVEVEVIEDELDDRDRKILDVLKDGMKTAQEIMDVTGIPKSPLYRRLKKLESLGYIGSIRRSGVKYFYLKGESE